MSTTERVLHTPGPWVQSPRRTGNLIVREFIGQRVAFAIDDRGEEEMVANAALISATPDLLSAAKRAAAWFDGSRSVAELEAVRPFLQRAIAKAEGREVGA